MDIQGGHSKSIYELQRTEASTTPAVTLLNVFKSHQPIELGVKVSIAGRDTDITPRPLSHLSCCWADSSCDAGLDPALILTLTLTLAVMLTLHQPEPGRKAIPEPNPNTLLTLTLTLTLTLRDG